MSFDVDNFIIIRSSTRMAERKKNINNLPPSRVWHFLTAGRTVLVLLVSASLTDVYKILFAFSLGIFVSFL